MSILSDWKIFEPRGLLWFSKAPWCLLLLMHWSCQEISHPLLKRATLPSLTLIISNYERYGYFKAALYRLLTSLFSKLMYGVIFPPPSALFFHTPIHNTLIKGLLWILDGFLVLFMLMYGKIVPLPPQSISFFGRPIHNTLMKGPWCSFLMVFMSTSTN